MERFRFNLNDIYTVKSEGDEFMDEVKMSEIFARSQPAIEYLKYSDEKIKEELERAEKALNMTDIYLNVSAAAKDLDMKGRDAMINVIGQRVYSLVEFAFQVTQDLRSVSGAREKAKIQVPDDFREITEKALIEQVAQLRERKAPASLLYPILKKLYRKRYAKDLAAQKIAMIQLKHDPLHVYTDLASKTLAALSAQEFQVSVRLPSVLEIISEEQGEAFLRKDDKAIFEEALSRMNLPEIQTERDDNGNLI